LRRSRFCTGRRVGRRWEQRRSSAAVIARSKATKQSILSLRGEMDCFASLAMTVFYTCVHGLAARHARALRNCCPSSRTEGAGKTGCALHPRSRVQSAQKDAHTSIQVQRRASGLPCAMVLRLIARSPRRPAFLPPSLRRYLREA
jgi:hypothetical protein